MINASGGGSDSSPPPPDTLGTNRLLLRRWMQQAQPRDPVSTAFPRDWESRRRPPGCSGRRYVEPLQNASHALLPPLERPAVDVGEGLRGSKADARVVAVFLIAVFVTEQAD